MWRVLVLVCALCIPQTAYTETRYKLLKFEVGGVARPQKWGTPTLGTSGGTITYALVKSDYAFAEGVGSCPHLRSPQSLRERSAFTEQEFLDQVAQGFRVWEGVANVRFKYVPDVHEADIVIGASMLWTGIAAADVAFTHVPNADVHTVRKGAICLHDLMRFSRSRGDGTSSFNVRHVIAHEAGHLLGLDHPGVKNALMGFRYNPQELSESDRIGIRELYGPAPAH